MAGRVNSYRVSIVVILVIIAIVGGFIALSRYDRTPPFEVTLARETGLGGTVYVGDGVALPGFYPFSPDDTIGGLLDAAGGIVPGADADSLRLDVPVATGEDPAQRIDINRAESWLLQALPGIGETLAQRIIDFRLQNGPFRNNDDLMEVSGIGKDNYSKIKDLITVNGD